MAPPAPWTMGAVLCGGASRRMGTDKAFVEVDGRPMVSRVVHALVDGGVGEVVAVGGDGPRLERLGLQVVADDHPGDGPLGGVLTALNHASRLVPAVEVVVVVACDLALLDGTVVSRLRAAMETTVGGEPVDLALAESDRDEPLCAAWRVATCRPVLASGFEAGDRAMSTVVGRLRVTRVPVALRSVHNVNGPADLHGL